MEVSPEDTVQLVHLMTILIWRIFLKLPNLNPRQYRMVGLMFAELTVVGNKSVVNG